MLGSVRHSAQCVCEDISRDDSHVGGLIVKGNNHTAEMSSTVQLISESPDGIKVQEEAR